MAATGLDWETILDTMTLPRYEDLQKEWMKAPPLHVAFAAFAGCYQPEAKEEATQQNSDLLTGLLGD